MMRQACFSVVPTAVSPGVGEMTIYFCVATTAVGVGVGGMPTSAGVMNDQLIGLRAVGE